MESQYDGFEAKAALIRSLNHAEAHHVNERATRFVYEKIVKEGDIVLDCGANLGLHCRPLSKLVGSLGKVHAFEPNPDLFKGIIEINANVRLWPFAVGDKLSTVTLHVPHGLIGWASLTDIRHIVPERDFTLFTTLQVRLDDLPELHDQNISFAKIDVERNELYALRGMERILERRQTSLIFENLTPEIFDLMRHHEYKIYELFGSELLNSSRIP